LSLRKKSAAPHLVEDTFHRDQSGYSVSGTAKGFFFKKLINHSDQKSPLFAVVQYESAMLWSFYFGPPGVFADSFISASRSSFSPPKHTNPPISVLWRPLKGRIQPIMTTLLPSGAQLLSVHETRGEDASVQPSLLFVSSN